MPSTLVETMMGRDVPGDELLGRPYAAAMLAMAAWNAREGVAACGSGRWLGRLGGGGTYSGAMTTSTVEEEEASSAL